jgi:hypothetical protein
MWELTALNEALRSHLESTESMFQAESTRFGLDALREIDLHPIINQGLINEGIDALREVCFPSTDRTLLGRNARERVDLVLLPDGKKSLYDPVDAHKELHRASGTLFEPVASLPQPMEHECDPSDAFWVEIKCIPQFRYVDGVPVPNTKYAHEIIAGPSEDVIKLASDPLIRHAGVLVVVFNELEVAGPHDIAMSVREMIDRDLPVGMPEIEQLPIQDRGGNAWCTLGLIPVRM